MVEAVCFFTIKYIIKNQQISYKPEISAISTKRPVGKL